LHERFIAHRDIKPENIVISTEGVAKLCDLGWAAVMESSRNTYCGTLDYVCPEILQRKDYDLSVDIWSVGILAYEMLMGKAPFEDKDRTRTR
jgi:serine/threonine protein kinase